MTPGYERQSIWNVNGKLTRNRNQSLRYDCFGLHEMTAEY